MTGVKAALQAFWSSFGIPVYLSDCVPSTAEYPYITYEAVRGEGLSASILTATSWHLKSPSGNIDRTEMMDRIADAIPESGRKLSVDGGGFLMLYRNASNFQSDYADEDNKDILGGRTSYQINFYL